MHVMATLDGGSTFWWISTPSCIFIHMKPTKGHFLDNIRVIWAITRLSTTSRSSCAWVWETRNKKIKIKQTDRRYISHIWRAATAQSIATNLGIFRDLGDIINPTKFCVDRYNRFGVTRGQSWGFSHRKQESALTLHSAAALARDDLEVDLLSVMTQ